MNFISLQYLIFLPAVTGIFYSLPHKYRWVLLLLASYYFYMCWKPEYLLLILASTLVDYFAALKIESSKSQSSKRCFLALSLLVNLGLLFFFKYFNFLSDSVNSVFGYFDVAYDIPHSNVLLPVGISFYTFQTLAYTIDVYRGKKKAEKHLGYVALYVAFFPQLVAGPIERASRLIRQFFIKIKFKASNISRGLRQILWGVLKKVVIADHVAIYVNEVYNHSENYMAVHFIIATVFFAFQIYCDFSGYSDIAIGSARLFGYDLMTNFNYPYFAKSIREFWQRWHISLSTWFRDYLYIVMGGNRVSEFRHYFNLFVVFLVSGLWHGANWTFVLWGFLHACYFLVFKLVDKFTSGIKTSSNLKMLIDPLRIAFCFILVNFAWIFFRANSVNELGYILSKIFDISSYSLEGIILSLDNFDFSTAVAAIAILLALEFFNYKASIVSHFVKLPWLLRFIVYLLAIFVILLFSETDAQEFIYFQF